MSKSVADDLRKISTSFLYKHEYFQGWKSGTITWTYGWAENKSSVGIEVSTMNDEKYLRIHYTQTDRNTEEKKDFDYKIPLTTTQCQYGGKRYWFTCPWYRNGVYCGRRVGTLYKDGDYFACRHCYNLTYDCRNLSGISKQFGRIISIPELEKRREQIKRTHYNGKITRKYAQYLKMDDRAEDSFIGMAMLLGKKVERLKN